MGKFLQGYNQGVRKHDKAPLPVSVRSLTGRRQRARGELPVRGTSPDRTSVPTWQAHKSRRTKSHLPFSSPLRLRKRRGVAFIHLSVLLVVSPGRKARWTWERLASAAAPTEGWFFIIVRLQTDAAWRAGWLSQAPRTVTCPGRGQRPHVRSVLLPANGR